MNPSDSQLPAELTAAAELVCATAQTVAERVCQVLTAQSQAASKAVDRNTMFAAQLALTRQMRSFQLQFRNRLEARMLEATAPRLATKRSTAFADWQSLTLVDDKEVEERMYSGRLGQQIAHTSEAELRELSGYMGSVTGNGTADEERNPLRPAAIGQSIYAALGVVTSAADERSVLTREFGIVMAQAMPACYAAIVVEMQSCGVVPVTLQVRAVEGPGNHLPGLNSGYASLRNEGQSRHGTPSEFAPSARAGFPTHRGPGSRSSSGAGSTGSGYSASEWSQTRGSGSGSSSNSGGGRDTGPVTGHANAPGSGHNGDGAAQDAQLMQLLRRLTHLTSEHADFGARGGQAASIGYPESASRYGADAAAGTTSYENNRPDSKLNQLYTHLGSDSGDGAGAGSANSQAAAAAQYGAQANGSSAGMMAVNLIRAHRDELMQASPGKLDHMVIDVVGSLFDQILSDTRVAPQMARQIARLQLPVLRVALVDPNFFSSRRHPVRRFVNRIASLACAFDNFDDGPGKQFVEHIRVLVQEIVDGDFDQVELYSAKLVELESFITQQAESDGKATGAIAVLEAKETDLRTQQRYLLQLQGALTPVPMPEFLRNFLSQVWSQALVQATRTHGVDSEPTKRYRHVGRDLVMSVQPKGSPSMRKRFLIQLPTLMRDLNEGLKLIGWPEPAQTEFFAQLLPAHADSLKAPAMTELDYNLLAKQLESVFNHGAPAASEMTRADMERPVSLTSVEIEQRFTPAEAAQVGLIEEQAVDWAGEVDIDLTEEAAAAESASAQAPLNLGVDINLDLVASDPAEPSHGAKLIEHLRIGFAYQMLLKDEWQKVRLTYMSPGRSFFVFTHGRNLQETISLTSRMLTRMCESERMRAVESNYLMERATSRTRKQLAALSANSRQ